MRAEMFFSDSLSLSLIWGLSLAVMPLLPRETGCHQGWNWAHHLLCGICLAEVIGGSAPTATLGIDLQTNRLFC